MAAVFQTLKPAVTAQQVEKESKSRGGRRRKRRGGGRRGGRRSRT
jgi:hypothetical protein